LLFFTIGIQLLLRRCLFDIIKTFYHLWLFRFLFNLNTELILYTLLICILLINIIRSFSSTIHSKMQTKQNETVQPSKQHRQRERIRCTIDLLFQNCQACLSRISQTHVSAVIKQSCLANPWARELFLQLCREHKILESQILLEYIALAFVLLLIYEFLKALLDLNRCWVVKLEDWRQIYGAVPLWLIVPILKTIVEIIKGKVSILAPIEFLNVFILIFFKSSVSFKQVCFIHWAVYMLRVIYILYIVLFSTLVLRDCCITWANIRAHIFIN